MTDPKSPASQNEASTSAVPAGAPEPQDAQNIADALASYETQALEKCQAELAELQAKSADLADQFLRAKADTENVRRRAEEDVSKARKFALESFADSLLPVIDSLEAGLTVKVIAINPTAATRFDPHLHQAISVVPSDQESNTVVTVLQKGYLISERVLRPALVTVSAPK